jgi:hypothetical protein
MPQSFPTPRTMKDVRVSMPESAFTIDEYAVHCKIGYKTAIERLNAMVETGQVKTGRFQSADTRGRMCVKNFYQNV